MPTISYLNNELVIAVNRKIAFVNPNDLQIFKEVEIPDDLSKHGLIAFATPDDEQESSNKAVHKLQPVQIQHVKVSPNSALLAVTTSGQKALILYKCRPEYAELLTIRALPRVSSSLTFASDSKCLLVTDKTGDCYLFDTVNASNPGKCILGHLSIVYDIVFTPGEQHIITCDRDEKIRVTNFPNCHEIESYCLGHTEYVSGIELLPTEEKVLLSLSGDKTIRIWDYVKGSQIGVIELPAPGIKFSIRKAGDGVWHIAVLLYMPNESVFIYQLTKEQSWKSTLLSKHSFNLTIFTDLCYVDDRLFLAAVDEDRLKIEIVEVKSKTVNTSAWKQMVNAYFKDEIAAPQDDISTWFKKKFDNISDYYERKKRRIEGVGK